MDGYQAGENQGPRLIVHRGKGRPIGRCPSHAHVLLQEAADLGRGEVLTILANPVIGAAIEEEVATAIAMENVPQVP